MDDLSSIADLPDLIEIASLTNSELFGKVLATIKSNCVEKNEREWINCQSAGQTAAIDIVTRAAVGAYGYRCQDDWMKRLHDSYKLYVLQSEGSSSDTTDTSSTNDNKSNMRFGEAIKNLPADGHKRRLEVTLHALAHVGESSASHNNNKMSVRQAAGLIRGAAYVGDKELQSMAISRLVCVLPRLSSHPCDIFSAVQTSILGMLHWEAFKSGGLSFSSSSEAIFLSMLHFGDNYDEARDHKDESSAWGNKRKRPWENAPYPLAHHIDSPNSDEKSVLVARLVEAARLARQGNQRGAKHGAILCVPADSRKNTDGKDSVTLASRLFRIIGRGWNHNILLDPSKGKNKIMLHSEVHAVADAIRTHGETLCFEELFPRATIVIAELVNDYAYEACHPCPKCHTFLRALGITRTVHSTPFGTCDETDMSPANPELLSRDVARIPFRAACNELQICCQRLEQVEKGS